MKGSNPGSSFSRERQRSIFTGGFRGKLPEIPTDYQQLASRAKQAMSKRAWAYVAGGAGAQLTVDSNRKAFERYHIQPRTLRDVSDIDTSVNVSGTSAPVPFMLAPIGVLEMAHPAADLAVARAAAAEGVPFIFSSQASVDMETCSQTMGTSSRWFQLYWSKNDDLVRSFVSRAETCGCEAIILTVDTTMLGWRPQDLDLGYLPFLEGKGIAQYISDPVFRQMMTEGAEPVNDNALTWQALLNLIQACHTFPGSFWKNLREKRPIKAAKTFTETYSRPSLEWEDLSFLRNLTSLPILLKGILNADDARRASECGMDGIIVSNHGGRQVDGAVGALDVLPEISQAVGSQMTILFDSGVRTGADIMKALALGADSVLLGRPYVYALALGGEQGVRQVIRNFRADLELNMGLSGLKSIEELKSMKLLRT